MSPLTIEQLRAFISKTEFDFASPAGWQEFLAERAEYGRGRDADGLQLRDVKNYAVGTAFVGTTGSPVRARFNIRSLGTGLALAPAVLYIYHPDGAWNMKVTTFYVGPPTSSLDFTLQVGGGGTPTRPEWGSLYYIIIKSGELPGSDKAATAARKVIKEAFKTSKWFGRGFSMLTRGGAGYTVTLKVGSNPQVRDQFMPQKIFSEEAQDRLRQLGERAHSTIFPE